MNRREALRNLGAGGLALAAGPRMARADDAARPNILLIFIDDMGWPAAGRYGNRLVPTPNIDRLAREGMRFTDAYATPQCTPSRASLLTGQHTARNGMWHVIPRYHYPFAQVLEPRFVEHLPRETHTLAEALQDAGYKTACLGKWHLTNNGDGYYTYLNESGMSHFGFDYVNPKTDPSEYHKHGDKGVDFLTGEAISFMRRNRGGPFFAYLSHHTVHGPVLAPDGLVQKYRDMGYPEDGLHSAVYLAAIEHLDRSAGRLLDALDELGIADNTLVLFIADNGGVDTLFDNAPLRHGKGSAYEGGIRVPWLARWPKAVEAGALCRTPVHIIDVYPTLAEIAGAAVPGDHILDGESILPLLRQSGAWNRDALYWYMPLYDKRWGATPSAVIRKGGYKLIEFFGDYIDLDRGGEYIPEGRTELYHLGHDIGEQWNLAPSMPERTRALRGELLDWIESAGAEIPRLNPNFDPARALEERRG